MRSNANILFAVLIVLGVVSCGAPDNTAKEGNPPANTAQESGRTPRDVLPPRVGAQENTAPCPAHLIGYCRGWELYESDPALRPDPNNPNDLGHIDYCDRVVIGTKSNGTNPDLWLFAIIRSVYTRSQNLMVRTIALPARSGCPTTRIQMVHMNGTKSRYDLKRSKDQRSVTRTSWRCVSTLQTMGVHQQHARLRVARTRTIHCCTVGRPTPRIDHESRDKVRRQPGNHSAGLTS
jgi:hypothetical protein